MILGECCIHTKIYFTSESFKHRVITVTIFIYLLTLIRIINNFSLIEVYNLKLVQVKFIAMIRMLRWRLYNVIIV